jgi:hypothetical protein
MTPKKQLVSKSSETPMISKSGVTKRAPSKRAPSRGTTVNTASSSYSLDALLLWKVGRVSGGIPVRILHSYSVVETYMQPTLY